MKDDIMDPIQKRQIRYIEPNGMMKQRRSTHARLAHMKDAASIRSESFHKIAETPRTNTEESRLSKFAFKTVMAPLRFICNLTDFHGMKDDKEHTEYATVGKAIAMIGIGIFMAMATAAVVTLGKLIDIPSKKDVNKTSKQI